MSSVPRKPMRLVFRPEANCVSAPVEDASSTCRIPVSIMPQICAENGDGAVDEYAPGAADCAAQGLIQVSNPAKDARGQSANPRRDVRRKTGIYWS